MNIIYASSVTPLEREQIERFIEPVRWLIPRWCLECDICTDYSTDSSEIASVSVSYEYRRITIYVTTNWLGMPDDRKTQALAHELVHGFIAPLADEARKLIDELTDDEKLADLAKRNIREKHEAITQDFSHAITRQSI